MQFDALKMVSHASILCVECFIITSPSFDIVEFYGLTCVAFIALMNRFNKTKFAAFVSFHCILSKNFFFINHMEKS